MPQLTGRMAIVGNKDVVSLSTVDVYELASAIGAQFEKMIDCHGPDSVTGLMPMVIRVLEHLEELTKHSESDQTEIYDLQFAVERMQTEKKLKADERVKFEKELEQIEEMWKSDAKSQRDVISRLEDENQRLTKSLHEKLFDASLRDEEENRICELNARIYSLEQTVSKQREDIRSLEKELSAKTTDTEVLQAHLEHLTRINEDHRRRSSVIQRQAQQLVEDKADLQAVLHDKDLEVTRIRSQLHRLSGLGDPTAFNSVPVGASNVEDFNPKGIEIQRKEDAPVTVLDDYKPDSAVVDQGETLVNEEERDPPVQGPINREPDEKLYPRSRVNKESGIRKFFKFLLASPSLSSSSKTADLRSKQAARVSTSSNIPNSLPNTRHGYCWQ